MRPDNFRKYLFEDAVEQSEFRKQHEGFVEVLRSEGVGVLLLGEILEQSTEAVRLIKRDPNLVYVRDTVAVTQKGYVRMRMKTQARSYEPRVVEKALLQLNLHAIMTLAAPGTMEGGDLIFLDEETLLVGVGNRTIWNAVRQLVKSKGLRRLIAVPLSSRVIHLDGTMIVIDRDLAVIHPPSLSRAGYLFEQEKMSRRVSLIAFLRKLGMRFIEVTDYERQRRATNVVTLGPRKIVMYAGNARVAGGLRREGADVIEVEGSELVRGGGGPRCLTAPILRY